MLLVISNSIFNMMDIQQLFSENVNEICYLLLNARYGLNFMS